MIAKFDTIRTPRLLLAPIEPDVARAIVEGDLSSLKAADGWPHPDTADGVALAIEHGQPAGWLVTLDGRVIGDCGTHGPVDETGGAEIGYGLASPYWGQGYGSEVVAAISDWLLAQPGVRLVRARTLPVNAASRRVLEKAGYSEVGLHDGETVYERER